MGNIMTLKEKIINMADETAKKLEAIPNDMKNMSELAKNNGKLEVLNELMKFMLENNI